MTAVVALGDSITAGRGPTLLGVPSRSWAAWLADALGLDLVNHAVDGATAADVLREQLPLVAGEHELAALFVGSNDARAPGFDAAAYERDVAAIAEGLRRHARALLLLTVALDLGRPRAAPKPAVAGAVVRRVAARAGAVVCELGDLAGWPAVWPDGVHPTALGQLEIADRAARALGSAVTPSARAGRAARRGDRVRLAPLHARAVARDLARRAREGTLTVR